jgi:hypothetical protein
MTLISHQAQDLRQKVLEFKGNLLVAGAITDTLSKSYNQVLNPATQFVLNDLEITFTDEQRKAMAAKLPEHFKKADERITAIANQVCRMPSHERIY